MYMISLLTTFSLYLFTIKFILKSFNEFKIELYDLFISISFIQFYLKNTDFSNYTHVNIIFNFQFINQQQQFAIF